MPFLSMSSCNWDFNTWFQEHSFEPSRDFKGYSFDLAFKYTYVGETLWQHGGVQVLYKDRLSYVGTASEAEWKPIQRTTRSRPSHQGTESVEVPTRKCGAQHKSGSFEFDARSQKLFGLLAVLADRVAQLRPHIVPHSMHRNASGEKLTNTFMGASKKKEPPRVPA